MRDKRKKIHILLYHEYLMGSENKKGATNRTFFVADVSFSMLEKQPVSFISK